MWSGSELLVVWIGVDPCLDRLRSGPQCLCMLYSLDGPWKGKEGVQAASVQLGCFAALKLATVWAWQFDSLEEQQLQIGCWTASLYDKWSLEIWHLGSVALQQFVLPAWNGELLQTTKPKKHATITGPHINSPIHYIVPKVWIYSFRKAWIVLRTKAWARP